MERETCPQCGAAITDEKCPYCGTFVLRLRMHRFKRAILDKN